MSAWRVDRRHHISNDGNGECDCDQTISLQPRASMDKMGLVCGAGQKRLKMVSTWHHVAASGLAKLMSGKSR